MNQLYKYCIVILTCLSIFEVTQAQTLTYSEVLRNDDRNMNFEVLGNIGGNYLVYKNNDRRHRITVYDNSMAVVEDVKLDYITDKVFNIDFVTYYDYVIAVYQYQRGSSVYCDAAKIDGKGHLMEDIRHLDTSRIGFFSDNKIYYLTYSENREKILLYKMQTRNDNFYLTTSLFNSSLSKIDSTETSFAFNDRTESYNDLNVDNDGVFYLIKEKSRGRSEYSLRLDLLYHRPGDAQIFSKELRLDKLLVQDVNLKIDNQNNTIFVTTFANDRGYDNVDGLLAIAIDKSTLDQKVSSYMPFADSTRQKLSARANGRSAFDNFYIKKIVAKKDSGIVLTLENYVEQTRSNPRNFGRYGYYDPYFYNYNPGFYRFNRGYYNDYYSPYNNNSRDVLYTYNDILVLNLDKGMLPEWEAVINKRQSDVQTDNYLSFGTLILGAEIHYLFLQKDNNRQVISDFALQPNGEMKRYATIKTGERGYNFMPRLAKQVAPTQIIMPCVFRNDILFAKINF